MRGRAVVWIGVITTGLFASVGISFLVDGRLWVGTVITGLAVLRGVVLWRQLAASGR